MKAMIGDLRTSLRVSTAADAAFERQLFDEDRLAQFAPLGLDPTTLNILLDQQYRAEQAAVETEFPAARRFIIEHDGVAVGRLVTMLRGQSKSHSLHVISMIVRASMRRRGIGTDIIAHLGETARAQGATRLTLSVFRSNEGARRLYERLGFRMIAEDRSGTHLAMMKDLR